MLPRPDLRTANHFRPFSCDLGAILECDGSCRFSHGNTTVVATISFSQSKARYEIFDRAALVVSCSLGSDRCYEEKCVIETVERSILPAIRVLEYPRKVILCEIHVVSENGGITSCAVNAASLALMNAGIQLSMVPLAVTVFIPHESKIIAVDPDELEEKSRADSILIATFSNTDIDADPKVLFSKYRSISGGCSKDQVLRMMDFAASCAVELYSFYKKVPLNQQF
jgi:ribonuclease PH